MLCLSQRKTVPDAKPPHVLGKAPALTHPAWAPPATPTAHGVPQARPAPLGWDSPPHAQHWVRHQWCQLFPQRRTGLSGLAGAPLHRRDADRTQKCILPPPRGAAAASRRGAGRIVGSSTPTAAAEGDGLPEGPQPAAAG